MSGVKPLRLLQSIERKNSFQQKGLLLPGENAGLPPLEEEERGSEFSSDGDDADGGANGRQSWFNFGDEPVQEDQDKRRLSANKVVPLPTRRKSSGMSQRASGLSHGCKAMSAKSQEGNAEAEGPGSASGKSEKLSFTSKPAPPEAQRRSSKPWETLRVAVRSVVGLKRVEDDLRVFGAKHEDGETQDPDDPRYRCETRRPHRWYILMPNNRFRRMWEVLIILLLLYVVVAVPFRVCFDTEASGGALLLDWVVDALFILDVFINFFCAYQGANGEYVTDHKMIIMHYARTWMLLDIVASIPFYQFLDADSDAQLNRLGKIARLPKLVRLIRMLRLLKLLRVMKLVRLFNAWEQYNWLDVGIARMFKVVFGIFMVTHLIGCFWYFVAWGGQDNLDPDSWVYRHGIQDAPAGTKYLAAVYWSFSTLTTVGFGDISAKTNAERIFSIVCMVVGVSWYAFIISTISSIIHMFDRRNAELKRKQRIILQFMKETKVPPSLRRRILQYFDYVTTQPLEGDSKEMESVLSMLSNQLRTEVTLHVHRELIPRIPFLSNKTRQFKAACVALLKPLRFRAGDYISTRGQHAEEMYFLLSGRAVVVLPEGRKIRSIVQGSYFGEIGCMLSEVHRVSIVAATDCAIYALTKQDLKDLMHEFPDVAAEIRDTARRRIEHLNSGPEEGKDSAVEFLGDDPSKLTPMISSSKFASLNHPPLNALEDGNEELEQTKLANNLSANFPGASFSRIDSHLSESDPTGSTATPVATTAQVGSTEEELRRSISNVLFEGYINGADTTEERLGVIQDQLAKIEDENTLLKQQLREMQSMLQQVHTHVLNTSPKQ